MLSIAIQNHPIRAEMAAVLADSIGGKVEIVTDPDPDNRLRSPWRCYRHALDITPKRYSHRLILQDDVVVCQHFRQAVRKAVAARPDRLLVFFVGGDPYEHRMAVMKACSKDEPWALLTRYRWCPVVATCWPTSMIRPFLEWADSRPEHRLLRSDDEIVGRWCKEQGIDALASVPSLVEHPNDTVSLIRKDQRIFGNQDPGRVAACFIGTDCGRCALEIDWTRGPR